MRGTFPHALTQLATEHTTLQLMFSLTKNMNLQEISF